MPRRRLPPAGARTDLPPLKIIRKIILLQLGYYVTATALILFTTLVYGTVFSPDLVLNWDAFRGDTTIGWILGLVWMLNSLICVILLLLLVSRSKLIPDFALTIHFVHLVATSLYTHSIPSNWLWWGLQCASAALMTFLGMWACQWRELQPISFGGASSSTQQQQQQQGQQQQQSSGQGQDNDDDDDDDPSFTLSRGRGRGRGRGMFREGNEYEMEILKGEQAV